MSASMSTRLRCFRISCFLCRGFKRKAIDANVKHSEWCGVVGLEIHAQIASKSKLFSGAGTAFAAPVNSQVAYLDASLPGTLPVINRRCIEACVLTAVALSSRINLVSKFDRKHYFYSDLPAGYQITQHRQPIAVNGQLDYVMLIPGEQPKKKTAKITQIQLEQDSGKSLHDELEGKSLIDLNRAGMGLMEIVTEPDFCNGVEAAAFVRELQMVLTAIGTCNGKMPGEPLGVRSEVKNINSIKGVLHAIEFEIQRQTKELKAGNTILNETRSYDYITNTTLPMRDKERLQDYRFMPEPNLPPLRLYTDNTVPKEVNLDQIINVDDLKRSMPELPEQIRQNLQDKYCLDYDKVVVLVSEEGLLQYFTDIVEQSGRDPKTTFNLIANQLLTFLNKEDISILESPVSSQRFSELVVLLSKKTIALNTAKQVLELMFDGDTRSPQDIVEDKEWTQIRNPDKIEEICLDVIAKNAKLVELYRKGKTKVFTNLVGQVHKMSYGRADPILVNIILLKKLTEMLNK